MGGNKQPAWILEGHENGTWKPIAKGMTGSQDLWTIADLRQRLVEAVPQFLHRYRARHARTGQIQELRRLK